MVSPAAVEGAAGGKARAAAVSASSSLPFASMVSAPSSSIPASAAGSRRPVPYETLTIGAAIQLAEVSTVGQPLEVLKTHMAAYRSSTLLQAIQHTYARGGFLGFYQGLLPWAWIEASSKGAILFWTQNETSHFLRETVGMGEAGAGLLGGAMGGVMQAYTTMGFCTLMKTIEVTRHKEAVYSAGAGSGSGGGVAATPSTLQVAASIVRKEGVLGMYRGVGALAIRQFTNWGSRFGISRLTEQVMRGDDEARQLTKTQRLGASALGGLLACWNHPIEVIRIQLQRGDGNGDGRGGIVSAAKHIYETGGVRAFFRGVTPRVGHSVALTTMMVFGGDEMKAYLNATKK